MYTQITEKLAVENAEEQRVKGGYTEDLAEVAGQRTGLAIPGQEECKQGQNGSVAEVTEYHAKENREKKTD